MGFVVCGGASLQCSFGVASAVLNVLPKSNVVNQMPVATVLDYQPLVNIPNFGMCSSMMNPTVASATAAAMGILTPMPCMPVILAPWMPGSSNVLIGNVPALTDSCQCSCMYGGLIKVVNPGQMTIQIS